MVPSQNALAFRSLFVSTVGCHPTSKVSGDLLLHSSIHLRVPCLLLWVCSILIQVFLSRIKDNWGELGARAKLSWQLGLILETEFITDGFHRLFWEETTSVPWSKVVSPFGWAYTSAIQVTFCKNTVINRIYDDFKNLFCRIKQASAKDCLFSSLANLLRALPINGKT